MGYERKISGIQWIYTWACHNITYPWGFQTHAEHQFPISRIAWWIPKNVSDQKPCWATHEISGNPGNKPPMQSAQIFPCTIQDQLSIQKFVELLFQPRVEAAANLRAGSCYQACFFVGGVEDKVDQTCWGLEDDVNIRILRTQGHLLGLVGVSVSQHSPKLSKSHCMSCSATLGKDVVGI